MMANKIVKTLFKDETNDLIGLDENGVLYTYFMGEPRRTGKKLKAGLEAGVASLKTKGWREMKIPGLRTMERWVEDGVAKTPCGCRVEVDGKCPHGAESWLSIMGIV